MKTKLFNLWEIDLKEWGTHLIAASSMLKAMEIATSYSAGYLQARDLIYKINVSDVKCLGPIIVEVQK